MSDAPAAGDDGDPAALASRRRARWLLLLALLLGLGLRGLSGTRPINGQDWQSVFTTFGYGRLAANFVRDGLGHSGGMPYFWRLELADGQRQLDLYPNHPAPLIWLTALSIYLLGPTGFAVGLPTLLCACLSLFVLQRWLAPSWGEEAAAWGTLAFAVLPLGVHYAPIPAPEPAVVLWVLVALERYAAWLRGAGHGALALAALAMLAGGLSDWGAHLFLPGLGLHGLLLSWRQRAWRPLIGASLLCVAGALALGLHGVHMLLSGAGDAVSAGVSRISHVQDISPLSSIWLSAQSRHLLRWLTAPLLTAALIALALLLRLALRGELRPDQELLLVALPAPLLYVLLFPGRSINHDFFWYLGLPTLAGAIGWLAAAIAGRAGAGSDGWRLALLLLVLALGGGAVRCVQQATADRTPRMALLTAQPWARALIEDERAVILSGHGHGLLLGLQARGPVIWMGRADALTAMRQTLRRLEPDRRVVLILDRRTANQQPELLALARRLPARRHAELVDRGVDLLVVELRDWIHR